MWQKEGRISDVIRSNSYGCKNENNDGEGMNVDETAEDASEELKELRRGPAGRCKRDLGARARTAHQGR